MPTHLFWLVNMFTGGSASLFFMFGMIATYGGALTSLGAWVFAILAVMDDPEDAAIDSDIIPFAGLTVLNLATWFLTFTNLSVFEEWKLSQECVEWEDDMAEMCMDDYGYEMECPEEEYDEYDMQDDYSEEAEVCYDEDGYEMECMDEEYEEEEINWCPEEEEMEEEMECEEYDEECEAAMEEDENMLKKLLRFF